MKSSSLFVIMIAVLCMGLVVVISIDSCGKVEADTVPPVPFIHETHVEKYEIKDCGTCHMNYKDEEFIGLPFVGTCTACHSRDGELTDTDHMAPRKKTMFDFFTDNDRPWSSRAKNPDLVYYSHKVVVNAKLPDGRVKSRCETCHGDKADPPGIAKLKGEMLMDQCNDCHAAYKINKTCTFCHK